MVIISFTDYGSRQNAALSKLLRENGMSCTSYAVRRFAAQHGLAPLPEDVKAWIGGQWGQSEFLFIGAAGIAIRYIAPWVKDKFSDSPVIVMDEKGRFIIPLLSGHVGGAVEIAHKIAEITKAQPVITTATDVQDKFAVDVFAKKNGLAIGSRKLAKEISAAVLEQKAIGFYSNLPVKGKLPSELKRCDGLEALNGYAYGIAVSEIKNGSPCGLAVSETQNGSPYGLAVSETQNGSPYGIAVSETECSSNGHILWLQVRASIIVGIGCRRGTEKERLKAGLMKVLGTHGISPEQIAAFASIDLKKDEEGILELAEELKVPFQTFTAQELSRIEAVSSSSAFVKRTTGVDNVCERAARYCCQEGELFQPKVCSEGCTFALVKKEKVLCL